MHIDDEITRNWDALREQRGWSWPTLARHLEQTGGSSALVAWAQSKDAPVEKAVDTSTPKPRRKRLSNTADSTPTETA